MKKQKLTPEQENFFREMGKTIDLCLAEMLSSCKPADIVRSKVGIFSDSEQLTLTIKIKLPTT